MEYINATGRRKSSVARVYMSEGTGKITINKKDLTEYFPSAILQYVVKQPLMVPGSACFSAIIPHFAPKGKGEMLRTGMVMAQGSLTREGTLMCTQRIFDELKSKMPVVKYRSFA